jgi:hypothetical protein
MDELPLKCVFGFHRWEPIKKWHDKPVRKPMLLPVGGFGFLCPISFLPIGPDFVEKYEIVGEKCERCGESRPTKN